MKLYILILLLVLLNQNYCEAKTKVSKRSVIRKLSGKSNASKGSKSETAHANSQTHKKVAQKTKVEVKKSTVTTKLTSATELNYDADAQFAILTPDRKDRSWLTGKVSLVKDHINADQTVDFSLIKTADINKDLIGTLTDVEKYFDKATNPYQSAIDHLRSQAPNNGNGILVFMENDFSTSVTAKPVYKLLLLIFNDNGKGLAQKFTENVKFAYSILVKDSPFKNFNFPKFGVPIPVKTYHSRISQWEKEFLSLAPGFASFTMNANQPGSFSFGFEYDRIRNCRLSWAPQLPLTIQGEGPTNENCCLAVKVEIAEDVYSQAYICSVKAEETQCISEVKQIGRQMNVNCFQTSQDADVDMDTLEQGDLPAPLTDDPVLPPNTPEEENAQIQEAQEIAGSDDLAKVADDAAKQEGYSSAAEKLIEKQVEEELQAEKEKQAENNKKQKKTKRVNKDGVECQEGEPGCEAVDDEDGGDDDSSGAGGEENNPEPEDGGCPFEKTDAEKQQEACQQAKQQENGQDAAEEQNQATDAEKAAEEAGCDAQCQADAKREGCIQGKVEAWKKQKCHEDESEEQLILAATQECIEADIEEQQQIEQDSKDEAKAGEDESAPNPENIDATTCDDGEGENGKDGENGENGENGQNGENGENGENGKEGEEGENGSENGNKGEEGPVDLLSECEKNEEELKMLRSKYQKGEKEVETETTSQANSETPASGKRKMLRHALRSLQNKIRFLQRNTSSKHHIKQDETPVLTQEEPLTTSAPPQDCSDSDVEAVDWTQLTDEQIFEMQKEQEEEAALAAEEEQQAQQEQAAEEAKEKLVEEAKQAAYNSEMEKCEATEGDEKGDGSGENSDQISDGSDPNANGTKSAYCYKCHILDEKTKADKKLYSNGTEIPYDPMLHQDVHGPWDPIAKKFASDDRKHRLHKYKQSEEEKSQYVKYDPEGEYPPEQEAGDIGLCADCQKIKEELENVQNEIEENGEPADAKEDSKCEERANEEIKKQEKKEEQALIEEKKEEKAQKKMRKAQAEAIIANEAKAEELADDAQEDQKEEQKQLEIEIEEAKQEEKQAQQAADEQAEDQAELEELQKCQGKKDSQGLEIGKLPTHQQLVALNQQEGLYIAYRDCPQLKDFTDAQIRALVEDIIKMPGDDGDEADDEETPDDLESEIQQSRVGLGSDIAADAKNGNVQALDGFNKSSAENFADKQGGRRFHSKKQMKKVVEDYLVKNGDIRKKKMMLRRRK